MAVIRRRRAQEWRTSATKSFCSRRFAFHAISATRRMASVWLGAAGVRHLKKYRLEFNSFLSSFLFVCILETMPQTYRLRLRTGIPHLAGKWTADSK